MTERYKKRTNQEPRTPLSPPPPGGDSLGLLKHGVRASGWLSEKVRSGRRKPRLLDKEFRETIEEIGWNVTVPLFLCTSILYYKQNISVVSDEFFDDMCVGMRKRWRHIEHPHKHYIKKSMLRAGTGFNLKFDDLPQLVHGSASRMLERYEEINQRRFK